MYTTQNQWQFLEEETLKKINHKNLFKEKIVYLYSSMDDEDDVRYYKGFKTVVENIRNVN